MQRKQVWRKVASREIKADTKICRSAEIKCENGWQRRKKKRALQKPKKKKKCNRAAVELAGWCKSVKVRKVQQKWMATATLSEWSPCNIYFTWLLQATGEPGPPLPTQQESFGYNTSNNGGGNVCSSGRASQATKSSGQKVVKVQPGTC